MLIEFNGSELKCCHKIEKWFLIVFCWRSFLLILWSSLSKILTYDEEFLREKKFNDDEHFVEFDTSNLFLHKVSAYFRIKFMRMGFFSP